MIRATDYAALIAARATLSDAATDLAGSALFCRAQLQRQGIDMSDRTIARLLKTTIVAVMLAGATTAPSTASAAGCPSGPPMANYWKQGACEDAIQWCEVHKYSGRIQVYSCLYNTPSCAWAGVPYPSDRGSCSAKWTMWPTGLVRGTVGKYCIGRADYVYTRNATTFKVDCYPLQPISTRIGTMTTFMAGAARGAIDGAAW